MLILVVLLAAFWMPTALSAQTHSHSHPAPAPATPTAPAAPAAAPAPAAATVDDWVALATRIHGGLGSYVALGIRIGLDALAELKVSRGDVDVMLIDGPETRCPCIADGLLLSTGATPGRATLHVDVAKAPPGVVGIVTVRHVRTNRTIRYTVLPSMRDRLDEWNLLDPAAKMNALLHAPASDIYQKEVR